jgi:predicted nucleic acid-binding protein
VTVKVVDASAVAAMAFQEPEAKDVANRLRGHDLVAPAILRFELSNVCLKKVRKRTNTRDLLMEQYELSLAMQIGEQAVDQSGCIELAERFNLSAYDASYLWLAKHLGVELVTLDARLAKAMQ